VPGIADVLAGTYKIPLSSPKIVGTYSSRGSRLYIDPFAASNKLMADIKRMPFQSIPSPSSLTNYNSLYPDKNLLMTGSPNHQVHQG